VSNPVAQSKQVFRQILGLVPFSLLEKAEDLIQRQLGKGSGAWSTKNETEVISRFIHQKSIKHVCAIDAGANLGDWTYELLKHFPASEIVAFEPSKEAFAKLRTKFLNNKSVQCENLALGKFNGSAKLFADQSGSGLGSMTKRRVEHFDIHFKFEEEINVLTLDSWVENLNTEFTPNILKMDVEGHELDVLIGASKTLQKIEIIQFEFGGSNIDTRTYFQDFWYFFKEHNFDLYRITSNSHVLIANYSEKDECFRATNYLAVRK
jgi:FkbM family methyltransferase